MPEAPTIVPPAAPARPAAAGAPSAVPASAGEIHVTPPASRPTATPEPKPESAKSKLFTSLKDKANGPQSRTATSTPPAKPAEAAKPGAPAKPGEKPAEGAPAAAAPEVPPTEAKPGEVTPPADTKDGKKPSPWKLVDEYKGKLSKAEQELADLRKNQLPENDRKAFQERAEKAEARAAALEKEMAFHDISQTEDFKRDYVKPYEDAWHKAMADLKGIKVNDPQGGERDIHPNDILTLMQTPTVQARHLAEEVFGEYANDVMNKRNEILGLFEKQQKAIHDAKEGGVAKKKAEAEAQAKAQATIKAEINTIWQRENQAVIADEKHGQFFKPREGDERWNTSLQKGYELVDKAFSVNVEDPKLTPQQREEIVRRHAAVRNRAAAFGALRGEVESLSAQVKALTDELAQYKDTEPPNGAGRTPNQALKPGSGSAKASMFEALRNKAR